MPDFERLFDGLEEYLAKTPEEKAYVKGFQDGKNMARKQILRIGIGFGLGWALWSVLH